MTTIESFSTKLKKLREEKGLNQSELGEALGVSRGSISFYEKA
ncbi:MAG: helix-turn-helix transcriptional regulator, partial [Clostridia bacterium]|nr:helix-turn-helix transcriptional regulator [Clostridia bacterium]